MLNLIVIVCHDYGGYKCWVDYLESKPWGTREA
jgi:hypothetical protein